MQYARVERKPKGVMAALESFIILVILPNFWKQIHFLPPASIVAHRTLWTLPRLLIIVALGGGGRAWLAAMRSPRGVAWHLVSGALLAGNWVIYLWATLNGHIVEAALGYYLNPFLNMLFGAFLFGDRNSRPQLAAIGLALAGVALQVPAVGSFPWVALSLAVTFALYAVARKRAPLASLPGLTAEMALLAPVALGWLLWRHASVADALGGSAPHIVLVSLTGVATALPLLFFGVAARSVRLTTLGVIQFLQPTLQFLIGWLLYREPMTAARLASFGLIWLAVAIYAADALRRARGNALPPE
jgi:chloramphenicol-sensitive protein RarD